MSERKVLNKYYPPDFDVTKLPKLKLSRDRQFVIRIMAPFSMRCKTCGDYIYKGRKFNARQETVKNETYLGLRIYRFYIRCPKCLSEITFKTDPENTDYTMEEGATRNFEAFRLARMQEEKAKKEKEDEEANNPMKALENRTMESRNEMDMLEKLEELKDINARHASVDHEQLIRDHILVNEEERRKKQEEADEALVNAIFGKRDDGYIKRIDDFDEVPDCDSMKASEISTHKRIATDGLTEGCEDSTSKKAKVEKGVVAFSQIKTSSVVRVKKSKIQNPVNSGSDAITTESATTTKEEIVEAGRETSSEVGDRKSVV